MPRWHWIAYAFHIKVTLKKCAQQIGFSFISRVILEIIFLSHNCLIMTFSTNHQINLNNN
jgi:hypothetical protein